MDERFHTLIVASSSLLLICLGLTKPTQLDKLPQKQKFREGNSQLLCEVLAFHEGLLGCFVFGIFHRHFGPPYLLGHAKVVIPALIRIVKVKITPSLQFF